jgi:methionyl-tRNA formyltransferase
MRIAFLGSPDFALPSLRALARAGWVDLVVTQPDRPAGRGRKLEPTAVRRAATGIGLETMVWERGQRAAVEARLAARRLDALVVVAFGHILKPSMLAVTATGAVNVHASLLPRWRGVAPIERALLAGDVETGVTLMVLDAGIDTGPVLAQRRIPVAPEDTRVSLAAKLAARGAELLVEVLPGWVQGALRPVPQPEVGACYAPRLEKAEGRLDWRRDARALENQVRGLYEWPGAFTECGTRTLKVHVARARPAAVSEAVPGTVVGADPRTGVCVACGSGVLELVQVQLAGKPRVAAADLVRGRILRAGQRLGG